jgi:hypothetical protein
VPLRSFFFNGKILHEILDIVYIYNYIIKLFIQYLFVNSLHLLIL